MYFFGLQEDRPITGRAYKRPFTVLQNHRVGRSQEGKGSRL